MRGSVLAAVLTAAFSLAAGDICVELASGGAGGDGSRNAPFRSLAPALAAARPGDTIRILPAGRPIRGGIVVKDLCGTAEKPITIDGMNNILIGTVPLRSGEWREVSVGLWKREEVSAWSWVERHFMTFDGRINRMGRVQKGATKGKPFKAPEALEPGEWTVVCREEVRRRGAYRWYRFEFFLRLPDGVATPERSGVEEPSRGLRNGGVVLRGKCRHLVFRNIIAKNFLNDGFNLHGDCRNIHFENIAAVDCGDDGISAHESCTLSGRNMVFIGCATAICHIQNAVSTQENVYAENICGREFYFMNNTDTTIRNAFVVADSHSGSLWSVKKGERQRAVLEDVHVLSRNPRARFATRRFGKLDLRTSRVRLSGFQEVMKRGGVEVVEAGALRERIAAERVRLFACFGGKLEEALR